MIRALVVDDESLAREHLVSLLAAYPDFEVAGEARNGAEALERCGDLNPDVLFLDIEMPLLNGFDVVRNLNQPPLVVFATAYDEYAVRAFEANAIDYLLKPVQPARLGKCIDRIRQALAAGTRENQELLAEVLARFARERFGPPNKIAARKGKRIVLLSPREILHISIEDKLVFAHTAADRFLLDKSVGQMEQLLGECGFFRSTRADLVNLEYVRELIPWVEGAYRLGLRNGKELDVSRDRVRELKDRIGL